MKRLAFILIFLSICAALVAFISRVLDDNIDVKIVPPENDHIHPGNEFRHLFWFVQVSDIHISRYDGKGRGPDLVRFCDSHLRFIKPEFVLATGDLTDAKDSDKMGSRQYLDEWQIYHDAVKECQKITAKWFDIRGNHDAFDIPDMDHPNNLFRKYSAQGKEHHSSYIHHHVTEYGKYSFAAMDATPNPGPKRPFNFFGYLRQSEEDNLRQFDKESIDSNVTIWFGHYPTSLIATESGQNLHQIMRNVTAFLCGHLHTLGNLVPHMYTRQKTGLLELELGDWRDARIYRILAIDHDLLSFTDEVLGEWPVVLITNPKHAALSSPYHEPLHRIQASTHIRLLVFTPGTVNNVEVYIDGTNTGQAVHVEGPLYVLPWNSVDYQTGLHSIRVVVQDSLYNRKEIEQPFSVDGTKSFLPFWPRFLLMLNIANVLKVIFYCLSLVYILVLTSLRQCSNIKTYIYLTDRWFPIGLLSNCFNQWVYRIWLVSQVGGLFYPLVLFAAYIAIGPWFVGELLEGHTGLVFIWGLIVKSSYIPTCVTYIYGVFQLLAFNIPLLMFLGYFLHYKRASVTASSLFHQIIHIYLPLIALVTVSIYMALNEFPKAYGTRALILGPVRTGSVILALVLFYVARMNAFNLQSHRS
ncbi:hypothetical protein ACJMK2_037484 [Sinanodonta woodiana]|uniref:Calcineurin-like phosphoesterase domain-containing protein n=1 Tax=Sinanodonta woodiana TaxID=1069815 RepID=A0ABD3WKJ3_SINWO